MRTRFALVIATFFGAGHFPVASGTFGSAAAVPLWWAAAHLAWPAQLAFTAALSLVGMWAAQVAGRHFGVADSGRIVIDEVAGLLVTGLGVPFTLPNVLAAFVLFRAFDILKPWPASYFDRRVKNGFGVVMDDLVAGLFARGALALLGLLAPGLFGP